MFETRAADPDRDAELRDRDLKSAARTKCLLEWIEAVLAAIPEPAENGQVALRDLAAAAVVFLEHNAGPATALDAAASVSLQESLEALFTFGEFRCSLSAGLRFVGECVDGLRVGADRARPGHLSLTQLAQAGIAGRSTVFLAGLEEGRCFPSAVEDLVLLDAERRAISDSLRTIHGSPG
jgi:hypothetical protein